ncbi:phage portal protein [Mucilaginibacter sp.]|jgi:HK97 family phage portal protein|uniref:phage portal protein n=1 Tax=Mucilaginibacter sp. TaxID=1882438 RepID=UPI003566ADAF
MGILDTLFKGTIDKRVNAGLNRALTSLYNRNVFQYLFDGNIILDANSFDYVEDGYEAVGAVYECVDLIVNKIIACPRIPYRIKDEKEYKKYLNYSKSPDTQAQAAISKAKALEEVSVPAIDRLLKKPNPENNMDQVLEMIAGLLLLTGNSYLYGNGSSTAIKDRKWSEIWAIPSEMNIKSGGLMRPVTSYEMRSYVQNDAFPAAQIKHLKTRNLKFTNTGQQLFGMAPLKAYAYSLDILKNVDRQSDKQVKNGGKMALLTPENKEDAWNEDQIGQIGDSLKEARASDDQMSRTVPLSVAVKYTEIGMSSQEMELLKTGDVKADDVYRCYHMPLQFRNQDTATYNNLPVANRQLIYNAVYPWIRKIEQALTEFICTPYNTASAEYIIVLDYTSLPELASDAKETSEWLDKMPWLTPNEKRAVIGFGESPQDGMAEIFVNRNTVRLQDVIDGKVVTQPNDNSGSTGTN